MAWFADLSPYTYGPNPPYGILPRDPERGLENPWLWRRPPGEQGVPVLNVGWLDPENHPVPTAEPSKELLDALCHLCITAEGNQRKVNHYMGWHACGFIKLKQCDKPEWLVTMGTAEIRVIGDKVIYAAPDLIYHYVKDHKYAPPEEFVKAVRQMGLS